MLLALVKLAENFDYLNEHNWPLLHTLRNTAYMKIIYDERGA